MAQESKRCFFDITENGKPRGRIVIEVYPRKMPISCENFVALCVGDHVSKINGEKLHYKGSRIHEVRKAEHLIIGGDFRYGNGSGGMSIHSGGKFKKETRGMPVDRAGAVAFVSEGEWCRSVFCINATVPADEEYDHYILQRFQPAFGYVVEGLELVDNLSQMSHTARKPTNTVVIADCGLLQ